MGTIDESLSFEEARSPEQFQACLEVRRQVYAAEMGLYREHLEADVESRREPYDDSAVHLLARSADGAPIGSMRVHTPSASELEPMVAAVRGEGMMAVPGVRVAVASRLTVLPSYRRSGAGQSLLTQARYVSGRAGAHVILSTCLPDFVAHYQQMNMSFRRHTLASAPDGEVGAMVPIAWTPLEAEPEGVGIVDEVLVRFQETLESRTDEVFGSVRDLRPTLFDGLQEDALSSCLSGAQLLEVPEGDDIVVGGAPYNSIMAIVGGRAVRDDGQRMKRSDLIGVSEFFSRDGRPNTITAGEGGAIVLALRERNMRRLMQSERGTELRGALDILSAKLRIGA